MDILLELRWSSSNKPENILISTLRGLFNFIFSLSDLHFLKFLAFLIHLLSSLVELISSTFSGVANILSPDELSSLKVNKMFIWFSSTVGFFLQHILFPVNASA